MTRVDRLVTRYQATPLEMAAVVGVCSKQQGSAWQLRDLMGVPFLMWLALVLLFLGLISVGGLGEPTNALLCAFLGVSAGVWLVSMSISKQVAKLGETLAQKMNASGGVEVRLSGAGVSELSGQGTMTLPWSAFDGCVDLPEGLALRFGGLAVYVPYRALPPGHDRVTLRQFVAECRDQAS